MKRQKQRATTRKIPDGLFITFEGTEGSGKSTQCHLLAKSLRAQGYAVLVTREPGGTPLAETIRKLLLRSSRTPNRDESITPACESLLILAARSQHLAQVIQPALANDMVVLCDRFFDSTLAYQGYARNLDQAFLHKAQQFVANGLEPHLTFLLDLPVKDGLARRQRSKKHDRLDQESLAFHRRVREGFLALAKQHTKRIHTMDARMPSDALASQIASIIASMAAQVIHNKVSYSSSRSSRKKR